MSPPFAHDLSNPSFPRRRLQCSVGAHSGNSCADAPSVPSVAASSLHPDRRHPSTVDLVDPVRRPVRQCTGGPAAWGHELREIPRRWRDCLHRIQRRLECRIAGDVRPGVRFPQSASGGALAQSKFDRAGFGDLHHCPQPSSEPGHHVDGCSAGVRLAGRGWSCVGAGDPAAAGVCSHSPQPRSGLRTAGSHRADRCDLRGQSSAVVREHGLGSAVVHALLAGLACGPESPYLRD